MRNKVLLVLGLVFTALSAPAQNTSVTNNNTIVINGDVYYFRPSTTPSSPLPRVGNSNFISYGRWYGADAARAWASIADWAVEHCNWADSPVRPRPGERIYISSVEAKDEHNFGYKHQIKIYYWVVGNGERMEDGRRETRSFYFK